MTSGLDMYDAIRTATRELPWGSEFSVNTIEVYDLGKLTTCDLVSRGYTETIAKEVSTTLLNCDLGPFGRSRGLQLIQSHEAPKLLPEGDA